MGNTVVNIFETLLTVITAFILGILYIENWYYPKKGNLYVYKAKCLLHCFVYVFCFYIWLGSYNILWLFGISCVLLELHDMKIISKDAVLTLYIVTVILLYSIVF